MARLDEIAEGIVAVLELSPTPEPLPIDLWNHGPTDATILVRAVIDASQRKCVPLHKVEVPAELGSRLMKEHGNSYQGVFLSAPDPEDRMIRFYRHSVAGANEAGDQHSVGGS